MLLSDEEVAERVSQLDSQWSLKDGKIVKTFNFSTFRQAIDFVNEVAKIAEERDHHPVITIIWRTVKISSISFDVQRITERDFALANEIESLWQKMFQPKERG
jgi:4a-hydroxytetrahydrobiopterin dehydratase